MTALYFALLLMVSTALVGYAVYVGALVIHADFYNRWQKAAQCAIVLLLPLLGALLVHWFYRLHQAPPEKPERGFIPDRQVNTEDLRAYHRPVDD